MCKMPCCLTKSCTHCWFGGLQNNSVLKHLHNRCCCGRLLQPHVVESYRLAHNTSAHGSRTGTLTTQLPCYTVHTMNGWHLSWLLVNALQPSRYVFNYVVGYIVHGQHKASLARPHGQALWSPMDLHTAAAAAAAAHALLLNCKGSRQSHGLTRLALTETRCEALCCGLSVTCNKLYVEC
jgi:hypothetical protein